MYCYKLPNGIILNKFAYKFISCSNIDFYDDEQNGAKLTDNKFGYYYFTVKLYSIYEKKVENILFKSISSIDIDNMRKEIKQIFDIKY